MAGIIFTHEVAATMDLEQLHKSTRRLVGYLDESNFKDFDGGWQERFERSLHSLEAYVARAPWAANKRFEISKFKFKFSRARTYALIRARSRRYRSQILQVNTR